MKGYIVLAGFLTFASAVPHPALPQHSMTLVAPAGPTLQHPSDQAALPYYLYVPSRLDPSARPIVAIHGISRRADEHIQAFAPWGELTGRIVIAPFFSKEQCPRYQQLVVGACQADRAFLATLRAASEATGMSMARVDIFGFSGGAQFAHRFAMMYPDRVGRLAVSSAGWYTLPDFLEAYPYGLAPALRERARFEPKVPEFLSIPTLVLVGEEDLRRDRALRREPALDRRQGKTRVERAARWSQAMRKAARERGVNPQVSFQLLADCGHSFEDCVGEGGLAERVLDWFEGS